MGFLSNVRSQPSFVNSLSNSSHCFLPPGSTCLSCSKVACLGLLLLLSPRHPLTQATVWKRWAPADPKREQLSVSSTHQTLVDRVSHARLPPGIQLSNQPHRKDSHYYMLTAVLEVCTKYSWGSKCNARNSL